MADQTAEFGLQLKDESDGAAGDLASELADLRSQIDGDVRELREMNKALRHLKASGAPNVEMMSDLKEQISAQKVAIGKAQEQFIGLGGTFRRERKPIQETEVRVTGLHDVLDELPGPIGKVVAKLKAFASSNGAARAALLTAAYVAMGVAVAVVTKKLLAYGLAQSNARRTELLRLEGLAKIRDFWGGRPEGNAKAMQGAIDEISNSVALGRDEIAGYQEELFRAGLRGQALKTALEGVSLTAATQGSGEAAIFKSLVLGAAHSGDSIKALTEDAKARLGDLAARQMLDVNVQAKKIRENFARISDGLRLERLLKGLNSVTSLLSQSTASGRALKSLFNATFQPMVDLLAKGGPIGKRFFQGMIIGTLILGIGVLTLRNALSSVMPDGFLDGMNLGKIALWAGVTAVFALGVALAFLAIKLAIVTAPIWLTVAALGALWLAGRELFRKFQDQDWAGIGTDIVKGIVGGLIPGGGVLIEAMQGLARKASGAFKSALGIASPSKLFASFGKELPAGAAVGVRAGTPRLTTAVDGMSRETSGGFRKGFAVGRPRIQSEGPSRVQSRSSGQRGPLVGQLNLHAHGENSEEMAKDLWDQLAENFEDLGIQVGAQGAEG